MRHLCHCKIEIEQGEKVCESCDHGWIVVGGFDENTGKTIKYPEYYLMKNKQKKAKKKKGNSVRNIP